MKSLDSRTFRPIAASLAIAGAGCARADDSTPVWSATEAVAPGTAAAAPVVAMSPDARITAAWVTAPDTGTDGRLMIRPDIATADVVELRDSAGSLTIYGETPPKIAYAADGTLYTVYLLTRGIPGRKYPLNTLRFAASSDRGRSWSTPMTVRGDSAEGVSPNDHGLMVGSDGTIYVTWLESKDHVSHAYIAHSSDRGASWSAPVALDPDPACPCCRTAVASAPDGTLYAAWRKVFPQDSAVEVRDIVVARSVDKGNTWSEPVRVRNDDWHVTFCPEAGPSLAVGDDGTVHVAWWTGKPGEAGVRYAASRDGGATFDAAVALGVAAASRAAHVQLNVTGRGDSAVITAAWDDGTRAVTPVVARVSRDGGKSFSAATTLSGQGRAAGYPVVARRGDSVVVAWQEKPVNGAAPAGDSAHQTHGQMSGEPMIKSVGSWSVMMRAARIALQ